MRHQRQVGLALLSRQESYESATKGRRARVGNKEKLEVEIGDLLLDSENPRTGQVESQSEALAAIVRLSSRNFKNMMRSIKLHGLDPGDSFYLVQEGEEDDPYTVVDGNRRLAALKVLSQPDLLHGTDLSESMKKPLIKEADGYSLPGENLVPCVLFEDRVEANDWIERRHGTRLEGEGRIPWGTLEIQRFQNDRTVLDVISFVEKNSTFSDPEWARIKSAVEKNTSTLRRFLESKAGQNHLGFNAKTSHGGPEFTYDPAYEVGVLSQIFADIDAGEINTRTHNKASDIQEYFDALAGPLSVKGKKAGTPREFATTVVNDGTTRPRQIAKAARTVVVKAKRITPPRATLAPKRHPFVEPTNEKGRQLVREASRLKLKETPLGCAFLFRAMIEYTIDTEMRASRLPKVENGTELDLQTRFERVVTHLTAQKRVSKGDLAPIKTTLTAKNGPVSIGALNGYIHSRFQLASTDELRNAWDHAEPLFVAIYGSHP
jgi:hypothetical protein